MVWLPSVRTAAVPRRCSTSSAVSPPGRLPVRSHRTAERLCVDRDDRRPVGGDATRALRSPCNA